MAASPSLEQIEARLCALERKDEENTAEIKKLKWENVHLKLVNADLEKKSLCLEQENSETSEKLKSVMEITSSLKDSGLMDRLCDIEKRNQRMKSKLNKFSKGADKTTETISHLEKEVLALRGLQKVLNTLMVNNHDGGSEAKISSLQADVKAVDNKVETIGIRLEATKESVKETDDKVKAVGSELKVLSDFVRLDDDRVNAIDDDLKTTKESIKETNSEIKVLFEKVSPIEKHLDDRKKSAFKVQVVISKPLETGVCSELDRLDLAYLAGSSFCRDSCVFECPLNGLYGICVGLKQKGAGMMKIRLVRDGSRLRFVTFLTKGADHEYHKFFIYNFLQGQRVWLEVCRFEGDAVLDFCQFAGFLIQPRD